MKYWIERWAELRYKEMVSYPKDFQINSEYSSIRSEDELRNGFEELFQILKQIYKECSVSAEKMLLPMHETKKYRYLSNEERTSRGTSNKYGKLLYVLGCAGELNNNCELIINVKIMKELCKKLHITGIDGCLGILANYGFLFDGLSGDKNKNVTEIVMQYPDNMNVLAVLYILATKAQNTNQMNAFCRLNYRLLKDNWTTADFGQGIDYVADVLSEQDREVAVLIHDELMKRNYLFGFQDWNEGPQIRYYKNEADCKRRNNAVFWLASMDTDMQLFFRIKNMDKGLELINNGPDSVIQNLSVSDSGCGNRWSGKCKAGVSYELNGKEIWRCGCCNPNFKVKPMKEDYLFYLDLVEETCSKQ